METDIVNIGLNDNSIKEVKKICCNCNCNCRNKESNTPKEHKERKEYVKRAQRNYRLRKIEADPNYKENARQKRNEYIENNREKYNESMRLYMREYRARKKTEQTKNNVTQITDDISAIDITIPKTE